MGLNSYTCGICGRRKFDKTRFILFFPFDDPNVLYIPIQGRSLLACMECNLSWMTQTSDMSLEEVESYIKWINDCENEDK